MNLNIILTGMKARSDEDFPAFVLLRYLSLFLAHSGKGAFGKSSNKPLSIAGCRLFRPNMCTIKNVNFNSEHKIHFPAKTKADGNVLSEWMEW